MMIMDWAISQTRFLTLLSIICVGKPLLPCQIRMVSAALWLTPTLAFLTQTGTCRVGIWIVSASATTDFCNQKASHYILHSEWCSMIEWWISNACYSKQAWGVMNILSRVMQCGSSGQQGVSKVLWIVCKVGRQGEYIHGLGGFSSIYGTPHLDNCVASKLISNACFDIFDDEIDLWSPFPSEEEYQLVHLCVKHNSSRGAINKVFRNPMMATISNLTLSHTIFKG